MSQNINGIPIIYVEPPSTCELCGATGEELRPYGVNGARICYPCAQKDVRETEYQMLIRLFGETPEYAEEFVTKKHGPKVVM